MSQSSDGPFFSSPLSSGRKERIGWILAHPVRASLFLGAFWGLLVGLYEAWRRPNQNFLAIVIGGVVIGVLIFGPLFVLLFTRIHRKTDRL